MSSTQKLDNITIALVRPRFPENIGAAARAMMNMGIKKLSIIEPERYELDKVLKMSTHVAADVIHNAHIFNTLEEALSDMQFVVGTSARQGRQRSEFLTPSEMALSVSPICENNKTAILFGPEDKGLSNDDLVYCNHLVHIPTSGFSSLNLAQAVMVICYELFKNIEPENEKHIPRLATQFELEGMYEHLRFVMKEIDFYNPENPDYWTNRFRDFFQRIPLRAKEVKLIRGILKKTIHYGATRQGKGFENNTEK